MLALVNPIHCNSWNGFELQHVIDHHRHRRSLGKASAVAVCCVRAPWQWPRCGTATGVWLRLGGLKIAIEIHKYAMYKNQMYSHKCSLVGNTNINWGEMAYFHCIIMPNAQLKLGAQKYEFVIRTWNSESMLSGTGDVRHEFMCSEWLKDEVEQLLKLSFSMFNQLLHSLSTHVCSVARIQVIIFDSHYNLVGQSDHNEILLIPYLFHNCTCMYFIRFDIQQYVTFKDNTQWRWSTHLITSL